MNPVKYKDQGSGNALLLIHGFNETKEVWDHFTEPLSHHFRVITADIPGYGESKQVSDYSMDQLAVYFKELIQNLDVGKCMVAGHSLGGYIALALADHYPDLISGLCLFHSTAFADDEDKKQARDKGIQFIENNNVKSFVEPFFTPLFSSANKEKFSNEIEQLVKRGIETPAEVVQKTLAGMRDRPDRTHVLKSARFPVMFIIGKDDAAVPLEKSLEQCYLPARSWAVFLSETGHMGMFEKPSETLYAVKNFTSWVNMPFA